MSTMGGGGLSGEGSSEGDGESGPMSSIAAGGNTTISYNIAQSPDNGIQNVGSILALLNQGSDVNGAVNYQNTPLFSSLEPIGQDTTQPATAVGPSASATVSTGSFSGSSLALLAIDAVVVLVLVMRK